MHHYGIIALLPALVVIVLAIFTKLSLEPLIIGCLVGFAIVAPYEGMADIASYVMSIFSLFADSIQHSVKNESYQYVAIVCFLYGALIELVVKSGGIKSFSHYIIRRTQSRKRVLLISYLLGSILFIDDYLSALMNGSAMRKVTDQLKVSREMLAFVVSSTAIPICIIVPVSTWTIFLSKLLEDNHLALPHQGLQAYLQVIPFVLYGWVQYLLVPLVILGVIPLFGAMKKAQQRAQLTGQTIPDASENFTTHSEAFNAHNNNGVWTLLLPIALSITLTVVFDFDALKGVLTTLFVVAIIFIIKKVCRFQQVTVAFIEGAKTMLYGLILLLLSFVLKDVGDQMGLTQFVIEAIAQHIARQYLPLCIFLALGVVAFATGNSFGLYAIAIPMVLPVAQTLAVNPYLCVGAVVSAGAFGAHACFYSDGTIMAAYGTECNSYAHAITQLPYALISFCLSVAFYLIMGYIY